jgi:hypothetical protein
MDEVRLKALKLAMSYYYDLDVKELIKVTKTIEKFLLFKDTKDTE